MFPFSKNAKKHVNNQNRFLLLSIETKPSKDTQLFSTSWRTQPLMNADDSSTLKHTHSVPSWKSEKPAALFFFLSRSTICTDYVQITFKMATQAGSCHIRARFGPEASSI